MEDPSQQSGRFRILDPKTARERLSDKSDDEIAKILTEMHVGYAVEILEEFDEERRERIAAATPFGQGQLWLKGHSYEEGTVGRLMERPPAVFRPSDTIGDVTSALREIVKKRMVVYIFVTEADGHLVGVVAFRELLFAQPSQRLEEIMLKNPFTLRADMPLVDAMREVVTRHYPVYPICDGDNRLLGMVKGQSMFEQQAFEISAQAGSMVGVEKEERLATPWSRSLKFRHPWLQLNLLTAFVAAAVVGFFEETISEIVLLAVFLPVLAGQCGNLGAQALAVTLRGITLNEIRPGQTFRLAFKEGLLGVLNGFGTGMVAAIGMYFYARQQGSEHALPLAIIIVVAMTGSCFIAGIAGATIPLVLRR
ncbi:MAG TPA: magnesium transporter, partial [Candidatus Saccharimonadia bacterium]|nr:magnesium transporter [Candidatus Saccharimonadia bacterium]